MDAQSECNARDLQVEKLSDDFGQYLIYLECECGYVRRCNPSTLAAFAGWEARLDDVVKRVRCTKCHARTCTARTYRNRSCEEFVMLDEICSSVTADGSAPI